jgi:hypothetical protein
MLPWITQFNNDQHKLWVQQGGVVVSPTPEQRKAIDARMVGLSEEVLKDKPLVKKMVDLAAAAAARTK